MILFIISVIQKIMNIVMIIIFYLTFFDNNVTIDLKKQILLYEYI